MSQPSDRPLADVIDFADFRRRRAARTALANAPRRQFLWGWTAGPQMRVEFPASHTAGAPTTRSRTLWSKMRVARPRQAMQTMHGVEPHIIVIGIPQAIIRFIVSQHILSISMLIMPVGIIMQSMPWAVIVQVIFGIMAMPQQLIIGMPEHIIPTGVPDAIMSVSIVHMLFIMSIVTPSAGIIVHFMPWAVIAQVIWHIMGIMEAMGMPIPPGIMDGMLMDEVGIICIGAADFMVTTRLDDQRYGQYNRSVARR
jgi:hypothetical protein